MARIRRWIAYRKRISELMRDRERGGYEVSGGHYERIEAQAPPGALP